MTTDLVLVSDARAVGGLIRRCRKTQGMRIDDAAALFGVSVDALSRLETGNGGVRLETLLKVLDGLGIALLTAEKASTTVLTLQRLRDQQD
jgi:transcriptional regulator with XRE-family HTH domain